MNDFILTDNMSKQLMEKILVPFDFVDDEVAIEKLFIHYARSLYDENIVKDILVQKFDCNIPNAEEIYKRFSIIAQNTSGESRINPLRTMEGDMEKVHGYDAYREIYPNGQSSEETTYKSQQDDTLKKNGLADLPKYEV